MKKGISTMVMGIILLVIGLVIAVLLLLFWRSGGTSIVNELLSFQMG